MTTHFKGPVDSVGGFSVSGVSVIDNAGAIVQPTPVTNLTVTNLTLTTLVSGATAVEINARADDSAMTETVTGAGAISVTVAETLLVTTGANALTLAAPTKPGLIKVITMKTDGGDGTLASTNIVGQSSGTTSITFNDAGDALVLVSAVDKGKWLVLKESGVTVA